MSIDKIVTHLSTCLLVAVIGSETVFADTSTIVFPVVYEQRNDASQKVLVIHDGYSLNLVKASVLSDRVLLRVATESGFTERYVDGAYHERHLYQDTSKQASLILKPSSRGHYHVSGLLNFTHRIEPLYSQERSSANKAAHRISKVAFNGGTLDAATSIVHPDDLKPLVPTPEERAPPPEFIVELYCICDFKHSARFGNDTEKQTEYVLTLWNSVSQRLQELSPPGYIALVGLEISLTASAERYLNVRKNETLETDETLRTMRQYAWSVRRARLSDVIFLITGRDLVGLVNGSMSSSTAGVAYLGQACTSYKLGIGEDHPDLFSGVHTAVHELGHLLSSPHDGEGASSSCQPKDGYVMSPSGTGMNVFSFSRCSQRAIVRFMWSGRSFCLEDHVYDTHIALLPNKTIKLPGQIMNGYQYCKLYFPGHPNVSYVKWDSDLKKCKFRCSLFVKQNGKHKYAIRYAFDGTPCNRSQPTMKCRNTKCVQY